MNNIEVINSFYRYIKFRRYLPDMDRLKFSLNLSLMICLIFFIIPSTKAQLRAAVVKEDITPSDSQYLVGYQERKSTGILDHIYHRIVAIDDGSTQFFIVSTDICLYSPSEYDKVALRLQREYGIDPMNVWWSTTHTHAAPEVGAFGTYEHQPARYR